MGKAATIASAHKTVAISMAGRDAPTILCTAKTFVSTEPVGAASVSPAADSNSVAVFGLGGDATAFDGRAVSKVDTFVSISAA